MARPIRRAPGRVRRLPVSHLWVVDCQLCGHRHAVAVWRGTVPEPLLLARAADEMRGHLRREHQDDTAAYTHGAEPGRYRAVYAERWGL